MAMAAPVPIDEAEAILAIHPVARTVEQTAVLDAFVRAIVAIDPGHRLRRHNNLAMARMNELRNDEAATPEQTAMVAAWIAQSEAYIPRLRAAIAELRDFLDLQPDTPTKTCDASALPPRWTA